jgi:hypothetical protein
MTLIHKAFPRSIPSVTSQSKITSPRRGGKWDTIKHHLSMSSCFWGRVCYAPAPICSAFHVRKAASVMAAVATTSITEGFPAVATDYTATTTSLIKNRKDSHQMVQTHFTTDETARGWSSKILTARIHVQNALGNIPYIYIDHQLAGRVSEAVRSRNVTKNYSGFNKWFRWPTFKHTTLPFLVIIIVLKA